MLFVVKIHVQLYIVKSFIVIVHFVCVYSLNSSTVIGSRYEVTSKVNSADQYKGTKYVLISYLYDDTDSIMQLTSGSMSHIPPSLNSHSLSNSNQHTYNI